MKRGLLKAENPQKLHDLKSNQPLIFCLSYRDADKQKAVAVGSFPTFNWGLMLFEHFRDECCYNNLVLQNLTVRNTKMFSTKTLFFI